MRCCRVETGRPYDVLIGKDLLSDAGELVLQVMKPCMAAIVTDDIVDELYSDILEESLKKKGFGVIKFVIPNGETSKNVVNWAELLNFLAENRVKRSDAVFALGGGVVGDLAGFAASAYQRGINFVQLPTTLLAAADSSVGGKTAVNLEKGKNMAGAFYQPKLVICDYGTLTSLPKEIYEDGMAEVIKYGAIMDRELLEELTNGGDDIEEITYRCVRIKADIVKKDEKDYGLRQLLNFGHTIGHAIERCSDFGISHGRAVAMGMSRITHASVRMGICGAECEAILEAALGRYSLPTETIYTADMLYEAALSDKKRSEDSISLVLPEHPGKCVIRKVSTEELREYMS